MSHSGVTEVPPILDYCADIWRFRKYETNSTIQLYLGLHEFCPTFGNKWRYGINK